MSAISYSNGPSRPQNLSAAQIAHAALRDAVLAASDRDAIDALGAALVRVADSSTTVPSILRSAQRPMLDAVQAFEEIHERLADVSVLLECARQVGSTDAIRLLVGLAADKVTDLCVLADDASMLFAPAKHTAAPALCLVDRSAVVAGRA